MKPFSALFDDLRATRVWRSIFRSGPSGSRLHSSLVVQQNLFLHLFSTKARKRVLGFGATWYLGALSFGTFLVLVVTGVLLMLYYHPSVPQAYADMKDLQFVVSSGVFLRNLHRWSAHAMVFLVFAHMFKVFYRGAYRPPREFNWVIGVVLLLTTLLLSYTGYLLPWDQLAYWAVTVGSNIASAVPVIGKDIRYLLLGGHQVNANALLRFYVLHCVILPMAAVLLIAVHFWRIRKDGGLHVPEEEGKSEETTQGFTPSPREDARTATSRGTR
jgi:cytochrome b6